MALTVIDLFCGCGGMSAGFLNAGLNVVAAFDNWIPALKTYKRNLTEHAFELDLSDTVKSKAKISGFVADVICGGPPCQDFSSAGKRIEGKQANLTRAFATIVIGLNPRFFLMENVPRVRFSRSYQSAKEELSRAGYSIAEIILDSSYCGVPQTRKRFFAFGATKDNEIERFLRSVQSRLSSQPISVKDYLNQDIDVEYYYRHPRNYSRRSIFSVHEPSPTIRGVNRPVPPNYASNHLDPISPTSTTALTSYERSRIQTFPKLWNWNAGNRNGAVELQIGNAIPVQLASFVAKGIIDASKY